MNAHPTLSAATSPLSQGSARPSRHKLWLVLLVCIAPVLLSYFAYYVVRPEGRKHYGELIQPMRPLPQAQGFTRDGQAVPLSSLQHQWLLVAASDRPCAQMCEQQLYLQRQIREGLGRDKDRLERVWLVTDWQFAPEALLPAMQDATVLRVAPDVLQGWLQADPGQALEAHLFVVDPMGHWMMRFPAAMAVNDGARALRDLQRLLRAASSWDQPGRPVPKP